MLIACDLFFSFVRSLFRWFLRLVVLCLSGCSTPGHANPAIGSGAKLMVITSGLWWFSCTFAQAQAWPEAQAMAPSPRPWLGLPIHGHKLMAISLWPLATWLAP